MSNAYTIPTQPTRCITLRRINAAWVMWLQRSVDGQATYYVLHDNGVVEYVVERPDNTMTVRVIDAKDV